ncbi:uncharacterized protein FA14DRAFT_160432 [Meira miltonrushii]|uniref:Uncharacterized protein n=1 Tax=Meira miltonrushii TaxID=1280837 RepID=A0A316VFS0_9BASI|nr:uncharacterized protein FA14DRAFT_160432 [Meira miltonrushii]PWN35163.1 hypothetical protein FA14DRAFT_160432 [Meira miltonrushii]
MGIVCSCFASTFLLIGEIFSTVFLAVGEVGAMLVRGLFSLLVGLCDVLAACMCCCQVPFSERPDRNGYTYNTMALRTDNLADKPKFSGKAFAKVQKNKLFTLPAAGVKNKSKAQKASPADTSVGDETKVSTESVEEKAPEAAAPAQNGWFGGWFGGSAPATATAKA